MAVPIFERREVEKSISLGGEALLPREILGHKFEHSVSQFETFCKQIMNGQK